VSYIITARCENGHSQEIKIDGELGLEWAKGQAGLLDGTSPMYLHSPIGTDSVIGKCGLCRTQIRCEVTEGPNV
jgi:hypothetical protein